MNTKTKTKIKNKFCFNPYARVINEQAAPAPAPAAYEPMAIDPLLLPPTVHPTAHLIVPHYLQSPKFTSAKPISLCLFQIRMDGLVPFVCFLLHRRLGMPADFPALPTFDGGKQNRHLKKEAVAFLQKDFPQGELSYVGYEETATRNILILKYVGPEPFYPVRWDWALPHELVNTQTLCADRIHSEVVIFFRQRPAFITLLGEDDTPYPAPVVGYYSASASRDTRPELADIYRAHILPALGKCYYFYVDLPPPALDEEEAECEGEAKERKNVVLHLRAALFLQRICFDANQFATHDTLIIRDRENQPRYVIQNYAQHTPLACWT